MVIKLNPEPDTPSAGRHSGFFTWLGAPMIHPAKIEEAKRLIAEGLSIRKVALKLHISRAKVSQIAHGKMPPRAREYLQTFTIDPPSWCTGCRHVVSKPCVACQAREALSRSIALRSTEVSTPKPPRADLRYAASAKCDSHGLYVPFELRPDHQARLDEVRRWREAHPGEQFRRRYLI